MADVFSGNKRVANPTLNRVGAQPFRAITARIIYRLCAALRGSAVAELAETGLLVRPRFLPAAEFDALRTECGRYATSTPTSTVYEWGSTRVDQWALPPEHPAEYPQLAAWTNRPDVLTIVSAAEQQALRPHHGERVLEHLRVGDGSAHDEQCDLHIDTPFNTHKLWLYLDDVTLDDAPFVYVPGSHRLDWVRLRGDYRESVSGNRGSRRITEAELRERGLERRILTCTANTLVVANTCGYHSRSPGRDGAIRRSLHMSFRTNPFSVRHRLREPFEVSPS